MDAVFDRSWWEKTWAEREDVLWQAFGPSQPPGSPPGYVTSIPWSEVPLPGTCVYTFPPTEGDEVAGRERRGGWLYLTHGLAQWLNAADRDAARRVGNRASGTGVEFALLVDEPAGWASPLLAWIMKYVHRGTPINAGDRVPFQFESLTPGDERWVVGSVDGDPPPADQTRALVFWRYLSPYGTFTTSTGTFEVRVATTVTGPEWELAKQTSSCHLLLLLDWAGIGQRSLPGRASVTERQGWEQAWARIAQLPFEIAKDELRALWHGRTRNRH